MSFLKFIFLIAILEPQRRRIKRNKDRRIPFRILRLKHQMPGMMAMMTLFLWLTFRCHWKMYSWQPVLYLISIADSANNRMEPEKRLLPYLPLLQLHLPQHFQVISQDSLFSVSVFEQSSIIKMKFCNLSTL